MLWIVYELVIFRSSYGNAPGGCACLSVSVLQALHDYAIEFFARFGRPLEINTMSGASHCVNSWHYEGNTMDVSCSTPVYHCDEMAEFCRYCYCNLPARLPRLVSYSDILVFQIERSCWNMLPWIELCFAWDLDSLCTTGWLIVDLCRFLFK